MKNEPMFREPSLPLYVSVKVGYTPFNHMAQLLALEGFTEFSRSESFRFYRTYFV